jgi:hypothetical protein
MKVSEPKVKKLGKFEDYEVQSALDSLIRAEEVRGDKALMAEVSKLASKKKDAISSIADLREAYNESDDRAENEEE